MCKDYVTETFLKYYRYDTIPIVRGGANYKNLLPNKTYIDTADFKSFKSLVNYLKSFGNNETLYRTYLKNMARYTTTDHLDLDLPYCEMCSKINDAEKYIKRHTNRFQTTFSIVICEMTFLC